MKWLKKSVNRSLFNDIIQIWLEGLYYILNDKEEELDDEEELDEVSESITELVLSMDKQGYDPEEIKDEVSKYLIDNDLYVWFWWFW